VVAVAAVAAVAFAWHAPAASAAPPAATAAPPAASAAPPAASAAPPAASAAAAGGDAASASDPTVRARELYSQGVDAMNAKDWARAEQLFTQAWALKQHFTIAGNLGTVELEQEEFAKAAEHLEWAIEAMKAEGGHDAQRVALERQLVKARAHAAALRLRVRPAGLTGVTVKIDGRDLGWPSTRTRYLPVGEHSIEVRAPDGRHAGQKFTGEAGVTREVTLNLGTEQEPEQATDGWAPPMWPAYVSFGLFVGLMVPFTASSIIGNGHEDDADALRDQIRAGQASCSPGCPELIDEYAAADTARDYRTGFVIPGAAALVFTIAWGSWALAAGGGKQGGEAAATVHLVPTGTGLAMLGSF